MTLATGEPILLEDVLAIVSARLLPTGDGSALTMKAPGAPTSVTGARIVADYFMMRAYGCVFDGATDDGPAINALIAAIVAATPSGTVPRITLCLPPGADLLVATPIQSAGFLTVCGGGMYSSRIIMKSGAAGVIVHGTQASPAQGGIQIRDVGFVDANTAGSGVAAVTCWISNAALNHQVSSVLENVKFTNFTQAVVTNDYARDALWQNVIATAPTSGILPSCAFTFVGNTATEFGDFTGVFRACRTENYLYAFDFHSNAPMEGMRFYSCTAYNGWGLVRAWMNTQNWVTSTGYQSPVWYFEGCDWQGAGFGLDLQNCRDVVVRGGFWTPNALPAGTAIPNAPDGATTRDHVSLMSFRGCGSVYIDRAEFDGSNNMGTTDTLVFVDKTSSYFDADRCTIMVPDNIAGGFEYESGAATNTRRVTGTNWISFGGATKILDPDGSQINQEAVYDPATGTYNGTIDHSGRYTIDMMAGGLVTDSSGVAAVTFPARPDGKQLFLGGAPKVVVTPHNTVAYADPVSLYDISSTGFAVMVEGAPAGYVLDLSYTANGY